MKHSSDVLLRTDAVVDTDAQTLIDVLADLSTYPHWNELVSAASSAEAHEGDPGPAWSTTLRAQVGPFARSKQLRFVRDDSGDDTHHIRFVRREQDGREHAAWTMEAEVEAVGPTSLVTLTLRYDGGLWIPALGGILGGAIDRATDGLPAYLESRSPPNPA